MFYVASQGKEAPVAERRAAQGVGPDYLDIPHTQIRKVTVSKPFSGSIF